MSGFVEGELLRHPWYSRLVRSIASHWDEQPRVEILGVTEAGGDVTVRYRASRFTQFVRVHIQHDGPSGGGATFNASTYVSSTRVDCRSARQQDQTVTRSTPYNYYIWLAPEVLEGDNSTYTRYSGESGQGTDYMVFAALGARSDTAALDAFGRHRVSEPVTIFDSQLQYDLQPLLWETVVTATGAASHLPNESAAQLSCPAGGDEVIRQTYQYFRYQPGKSKLVMMTGVLGAQATDVTQRIGLFDDDNGIFIEQTSAGLYFVQRSKTSGSVVNTAVEQASWNVDTFGTLDVTKSQIIFFDLEWLGVGRVRCGFVIEGRMKICHEFLNANSIAVPYMTTANLPLRYSCTTENSATATDMRQICCTVTSEGGFDTNSASAFPFAIDNTGGGVTVNTTELPILSLRAKTTFNSIANRMLLSPVEFGVLTLSNDINWKLRYNATTLTNASFGDVDGTYSGMQYDTAATAVAGGIVIASGFLASGGGGRAGGSKTTGVVSQLPISLDQGGSAYGTLTLTATALSASNATVYGAFEWRELR